jgi:hypothetical protein
MRCFGYGYQGFRDKAETGTARTPRSMALVKQVLSAATARAPEMLQYLAIQP